MPKFRLGAVAALLVAAAMIFWRLGGPALMRPDEGRNAEVAREMAESGNWLVPTLEGNPYLDKPAFFFVAGALAIRALGASELAARLPSALSAAALLATPSVRPRSAMRIPSTSTPTASLTADAVDW